MMTLNIFKHQDAYDRCTLGGQTIEHYTTNLVGYTYVMNSPTVPFKFIDGLNTLHSISPMNIDTVLIKSETITVILNLDDKCGATWDDIIA